MKNEEAGSKMLLVAVTKQQVSQAGLALTHVELVEQLARKAVELNLDKPNLSEYRDMWLQAGAEPY